MLHKHYTSPAIIEALKALAQEIEDGAEAQGYYQDESYADYRVLRGVMDLLELVTQDPELV